jgi:hypothetical protein
MYKYIYLGLIKEKNKRERLVISCVLKLWDILLYDLIL